MLGLVPGARPGLASAASWLRLPPKTSWSPGSAPESAFCQKVHFDQPAGSTVGGFGLHFGMSSSCRPKAVLLPVHGFHQYGLV